VLGNASSGDQLRTPPDHVLYLDLGAFLFIYLFINY
jgi:hypothetical protein